MAKSVRLIDIAKRVNVSAVTVSKALSGQKGVSEEMREKIIRLADEMGYVKNSGAQEREGAGKGYTIGVIVAERYLKENQSFYWLLYQEIARRAMTKNCFPMMEVIDFETEKDLVLPKVVTGNKVDGIIVLGAFHLEYARYLMKETQIPVVNLDTTTAGEICDCVVSNNMMGGYQMTNYLFEMGHKKIGFVGTRLATGSIDDRYFGYLKSLMEHGVEWRKDWVLDDRDRESGFVEIETKFVLPEEMPTAFFCNCDLSASFLIKKLEMNGYRVPEDVSVVGFDNYVTDQFGGIGITTYEINTREMAKKAVHILTHKIDNVNYTGGVIMIAGKFIERKSARRIGAPVPFI